MNKEDFFRRAISARKTSEVEIEGFGLLSIQEMTAGERLEYWDYLRPITALNSDMQSVDKEDVQQRGNLADRINVVSDFASAWMLTKCVLGNDGERLFAEEEVDDLIARKNEMGVSVFNAIINACLKASGIDVQGLSEAKKN